MTATHSIAPTLLVAIDISKHRHEVLIGIPGKKRQCRRAISSMDRLRTFTAPDAKIGYCLPPRPASQPSVTAESSPFPDR